MIHSKSSAIDVKVHFKTKIKFRKKTCEFTFIHIKKADSFFFLLITLTNKRVDLMI